MNRILEFFVNNSRLVNILSVLILAAGIVAVVQMPREIFPNVSFDIVTVTTPYPGATALEVENLVTNIVEETLREVDGLKEVWGVSIESVSIITLMLDPNVRDKRKVIDNIKSAVARVIGLPETTEPPRVTEMESKNQPLIEVALSGEVPYAQMREFAKELSKVIQNIPGVASVQKRGYYDAEIWIEANPALLAKYQVSLNEINRAIAENNVSVPGGILKGNSGRDIIVRTLDQVTSAEDIQKIIIRKSYSGDSVKISDVATVKPAFEDPKVVYRTNNKNGINLQVTKKEGTDVIHLVKAVKKTVQQYTHPSRSGIEVAFVNDLSFYVSRRLNILTSNGILGGALVIVLLFLFLNPWIALWVSSSIPLAVAVALYICSFLGITINLISMLGFVIVLGIVVDESIIIGENIFRYLEAGFSPREAAKRGVQEVAIPITATITTTIAAFVPLMFMSGIMGKFIWAIPTVIILSLCGSWIEATLLLPNHISDFMPKRSLLAIRRKYESAGGQEPYHWLMTPIRNFYLKWLAKALKHRGKVVGGFTLVLILCAILIKTGILPFILFESRGIETFFLRVEGPTNASLESTTHELTRLENLILEEIKPEELDYINTVAGETFQGMNDPFRGTGSHVGQVQIRLISDMHKRRDVEEIITALRAKTGTDFATTYKIKFDKMKPGPPVGKPLSLQIVGPDLTELKKLADQLKTEISSLKGVTDVNHTLMPGKEEWVVKIDKAKASDLNVSISMIAQTIRSAFDGFVSTSIRTVDEEIEIRTRLSEAYRVPNADIIRQLTVPNKTGQWIPLDRLISITSQEGFMAIQHNDWERYVMIGGQVDEKITTAVTVNKALQNTYKNFSTQHPGYRLKFKGEFEETQESMRDLLKLFVIAFGVVFLIIAMTFESLLQPAIIALCIPFSFIGVCLAFLLHGYALGFLAMIGVVGLVGVVVNDSIVFTEFMNIGIRAGKDLTTSIMEAGRHRIRPILLTTITTVFGLLPTAYGIGGYDPFLVPLCLAIAWGLSVGTLVSIILLPCFYAILHDFKDVATPNKFNRSS